MAGGQEGYYTERQYGTFQPPPFMQQPQMPSPGGGYYPSVPAYPRVADGIPLSGNYNYYQAGILERPIREGCCRHRDSNDLPFCGLGYGWFLFLLGFVCVVPWYVGAFIFCCLTHDYRERSGLAACAIAAIIIFFVGGGIHIRYFL